MATLTVHHYLGTISSFINNIVNSSEAYYLYIGRPNPWLNVNGEIDDTAVPVATDSVRQHESTVYNDLVFGKILTENEVAYMVPRHDWVSGTVYDRYSQDNEDTYSLRYYVVTDNYEVYKVIDNGGDNNGGAPSTVKPSLTSTTGTFSTSDGYTWKYMYTIEPNANSKFTSTDYIPVTPNTDVSNNTIGGTVDVVRITANGSNYTSYYGGYLAGVVNNNVVTIDREAAPTTNFYTGSSMYLKAGFGAGQLRKIDYYDGPTRRVHLDTPFDSYINLNLGGDVTGVFNVGDTLTQNIDSIAIYHTIGAFQTGDVIVQSDSGANGTIVSANGTVLRVVRNSGENKFKISPATPIYNTVQTGSIKSGTVTITAACNVVTPVSGTTLSADYTVGSYIRVGGNANNNIRRITAVSDLSITTDLPFTQSLVANVHYSVPYVTEPLSITLLEANGYISNTNIDGVSIKYDNPDVLALNFIIGEKVDMVDASNVSEDVYGIVSYSNSSTVIISGVTGSGFLASSGGTYHYIRGESSLQKANIYSVTSYPNITIKQPMNTFITGQQVFARDSGTGSLRGQANVIAYYTIPNEQTEYIISPTVTIDGDGTGAKAYSVVNTAPAASYGIGNIVVIDPGYGYTEANVYITSNNSYGNGAGGSATISPILGHGSNTYAELGARYAGISIDINSGEQESYKYPVYGQYRRVGIIENPVFDEVTINTDSYDRAKLQIINKNAESFITGEIVYQPNSSAAGVVVYANSSFVELANVRGTFSANGKFANNDPSDDHIVALSSNTQANVHLANVSYFAQVSNVEIISETKTAIPVAAKITSVDPVDPTIITLTEIAGKFDANDTIYDSVSNAYANVVSIFAANNTLDVTTSFGRKFQQTVRLPLTSNTRPFLQFERVTQATTNASGIVISNGNEFDIVYTDASGEFNVGNWVVSTNTGANGYITSANSTYIRITAADGQYFPNDTIINNLGITATAANVFPVLVLSNVRGPNKFQSGPLSTEIRGANSGAVGKDLMPKTILYPDLVRNSGSVLYLENILPFTLSNTSQENVRLIIKF